MEITERIPTLVIHSSSINPKMELREKNLGKKSRINPEKHWETSRGASPEGIFWGQFWKESREKSWKNLTEVLRRSSCRNSGRNPSRNPGWNSRRNLAEISWRNFWNFSLEEILEKLLQNILKKHNETLWGALVEIAENTFRVIRGAYFKRNSRRIFHELKKISGYIRRRFRWMKMQWNLTGTLGAMLGNPLEWVPEDICMNS